MQIVHVAGEKKGDLFLYTLSTCGWCRKMKSWLNAKGLDYSYVDVDLVPVQEKQAILEEMRGWNPQCSFPTVVVNKSACISGYQPERLAELLEP